MELGVKAWNIDGAGGKSYVLLPKYSVSGDFPTKRLGYRVGTVAL